MFTISVKSIYGLLAVVHLAEKFETGHLQSREIADLHDIPQHYLEQILVILKRHGIVKSFRGNQGGYSLAENPNKISVLEILECLEGNLEIVPKEKQDQGLWFLWSSLRGVIKECLDITLAELLMQKNRYQKQVLFVI